MDAATMYHFAERAAQWMERGDDRQEAQAVRQLIEEHKKMTNQQGEQCKQQS